MTVLFIGHGSPMNALEINHITKSWQNLGKTLAKPRAILAISAHWYVPYLAVSNNKVNHTIHDFYGFPPQLANFDYPSNGSPEFTTEIIQALDDFTTDGIVRATDWGLDHGVWSILTHIYPCPEMPIVQLSINSTKSPRWHFELAKKLRKLSQSGVLILCSGNIVHNLSLLNWKMPEMGSEWAIKSDLQLTKLITTREIDKLCNYNSLSSAIKLAIPTPEHFLPVLYALGASGDEHIEVFNQVYSYGSLSMTSFICTK